jgi:hypothetical protein
MEDGGGTWVSALLLAILFQDRDFIQAGATMRVIPSLAILLRSDEVIDRYFAAQSLASLVCKGSRGTFLAVANSGAAGGLLPLLGSGESDISNHVELTEEFSLICNADQVILECLFRVDDIRVGATARKSILALVELLKPMPDRPGAPPLALGLLTQIVNQLIAVLRLGSRSARYNPSRVLQGLFEAENIKYSDVARKAIQPLVELLSVGTEKEQQAAICALIKLS